MKTGLVLSGGGTRAFMHLGVLKALEDSGVQIDRISGTSAGAVVGILYACGYSPEDSLSILTQTACLQSVRYAFGGHGLLRISGTESFFNRYIADNDFGALRIPVIITATDLHAGETVVFREGDFLKPMLASCCLPGIFEPFRYQGRELVDGGIMNNMPVEVLENEVDFIIGSHCNPFSLQRPLKSTREVLLRSFLLAIHHNNIGRLEKCNLLIEPPHMREFGIFDFRKARKIFDVGYRHALKSLAQLKTLP